MKNYDVVVIGGGPAGISATLNTCLAGFSVALVEMHGLGGQILKNAHLENYPGVYKIPTYELADLFLEQLSSCTFDRYNDALTSFNYDKNTSEPFTISVGKEKIQAKSAIICIGIVPKPLGLETEAKFIGRGISYCALCDGNFFHDQVVAVVGYSAMAAKEAIFLSGIAKKVYLLVENSRLVLNNALLKKLAELPNLEIMYKTKIVDLHGQDFLSGVSLVVENQPGLELPLDGLFIFQGLVPQTHFFQDVITDSQGFIKTDQEMRTNIPGLFAAGDVRSKECRLVATAVGDGATAANSVFNYLEQMGA